MTEIRYCPVDGGILRIFNHYGISICTKCSLTYQCTNDPKEKIGIDDPKESLEARLKKLETELKIVGDIAHRADIRTSPFGGSEDGLTIGH